MKWIRHLINRILLGWVFIFTVNAHSASVVPLSLDEMADQADSIVVARCSDVLTRWQGNKIVTDVVLDVQERFKGAAQSQISIVMYGGTAMHPRLNVPVNMHVPGSATFQADDEVLVFSRRNQKGEAQILGLNQGKFRLERDENTGEYVISVGRKVLSGTDEVGMDLGKWFSTEIFSPESDIEIRMRKIRVTELIDQIREKL